MNTQSIETILQQVTNSEELMHLATIVLIAAAALFVVGLIFKAIRLICIVAALVICLSGFGFFSKAQSALEEKLGTKIPVGQVQSVIEDLKNGVDLQAILDDLAAQAGR